MRPQRLLRLLLLALLALQPFAVGAAEPQPPRNAHSPMGINAEGLADWSAGLPFIDQFKLARQFRSTHPELSVDADGWVTELKPGQVGETFILWDIGGAFPAGDYTVLYDGEGEIKYGGGARLVSSSKGHDVVRLNGKTNPHGIHLKITAVKRDNYIRNIRIITPGGVCESEPLQRVESPKDCKQNDFLDFLEHHEKLIFNPDYLREMADFKVIRFLNYMATNNSTISRWSERSRPELASWAGKSGAPVEILVELANRVHADPWFTLPHLADDEYVREFAQYVKTHLNLDLKAYVEYSNETWNGQFAQSRYVREQGQKARIEGDQYQAATRYYSRRAVEIFKIWEQVFGDNKRIVRVMGAQAANAYIGSNALQFEDAYKHVDAVAIAPYFGGYLGHPDKNTDRMSLDQLFDELNKHSLPEAIGWIRSYVPVAKKYNIELIAYEGGHHLAGVVGAENNAKLNQLFDAAVRDPRMGQLYSEYFDAWKEVGGGLFTLYKATSRMSKWGRWGMRENMYQGPEDAPMYKAVLDFIRANPTP